MVGKRNFKQNERRMPIYRVHIVHFNRKHLMYFIQAKSYQMNALKEVFKKTGKCSMQLAKDIFLGFHVTLALPKNSFYTKTVSQGYPKVCFYRRYSKCQWKTKVSRNGGSLTQWLRYSVSLYV